ncbi:NADH-quinone oxidoreductase subunit NuoK [Kribbella sp. NPDC050241]|uniref:NADH-quinone oxidoreductase subunit NuoK n=1 Tax=Kribbella sp. NPDC050241 TaxID=3364115 RepID=UPI0037B35B69
MPLVLPLLLAVVLFCIGVYGVLARRNAITLLMSFELMLNAVNLNLIAFDAWRIDGLATGQTLAIFVITLAAAEIGLGLAIVLLLFRGHGHVDADAARDLAEQDTQEELQEKGAAT